MTLVSFAYLLFAILGLSFLIFIHEWGHYAMARRAGMRVEVFSIGFGKPIYVWEREGVRWQIGWLLFGGYVKIAGMDPSEQRDPYQVQGGFFSKHPLDRIKVAVMGPLVNLIFAALAFSALWIIGGREKPFSEHTHKVGWVDPKSELYARGIRPGDEVVAYDQHPVQGSKDHVTGPMMAREGKVRVHGYRISPVTKQKIPFTYLVNTYPHPQAGDQEIVTVGILSPANYLIYDQLPNGADNPLPDGSPLRQTDIRYGDRIVWVDGMEIYSTQQLSHLLNDGCALLTVQRGEEQFFRRVPRVGVGELRIDAEFKEELIDWQYASHLQGTKVQNLYTIPYNLDYACLVEHAMRFIDQDKQEEFFPTHPPLALYAPLQPGDRILAVDAVPVTHSYDILRLLQQRRVNVVVQRDIERAPAIYWQQADAHFEEEYRSEDLDALISQIGISDMPRKQGNLVRLPPIVPKRRAELAMGVEAQSRWHAEQQQLKRDVEKIEDADKRARARQELEQWDQQLLLGLPAVQDQVVRYNPNPLILLENIFDEIWRTLQALFFGSLNPKWMSGPIGIVQVVHDHSMASLREALFWLGAISFNLGILNLLPLPVLDGGTICLSLWEWLTGYRIRPKTLEKLVFPFALLLIGFFLFLTYHDLLRLIGKWTGF